MKPFNRVALFSDLITLKSDKFHRRNTSFEEFRRVIFRVPDIRRVYNESFYEYSNEVNDIDVDFDECIIGNRATEGFKYYKNTEYYDLGLKITHHKSVRNYEYRYNKFHKNARIVIYADKGLVPKIQLPSYTANVEFEFNIKCDGIPINNSFSKLVRNRNTFGITLGGKHIYDKDNSSIYPSPIFTYDPALTMQNLNKRRK